MKKPDAYKRLRTVKINFYKLTTGRKNSSTIKRIKNKRLLSKTSRIQIVAPKTFSLNGVENRENLLTFFSRIESALKKDSIVHLSFKRTNELVPCGTLFFRAHMSLLLEKYPGKIKCSYPTDEVVGQLFQHIHLLEKMGLPDKYIVTAENVKYWHSVEGTKAETQKFELLLNSYENELAKPMKLGLYDSMSEAVTNCAQHAYETMRIDDAHQKWWMFANRQNNILTVAIYDAGIGIAESLRIKPAFRDIIKGLAFKTRASDKKLLQLAVGSNKSKTKLSYRGKGLPEMMNFVRSTNVGGLLIHSNYGLFMFAADTNREQTKDYKVALKGTLIQWTLPLIDEVDNE